MAQRPAMSGPTVRQGNGTSRQRAWPALASAVAAVMTLGLAATARAQVPADLVPGDAVAFVGWRGTLDPGPAYAGSKWAAIVKDSQLSKLIDQTIPAAGAALDRRNPERDGLFGTAATAVRALLRQPSAVFLTLSGDDPAGGIVCKPGVDGPALTATLTKLAAALPEQAHARVEPQGEGVALLLGEPAAAPVAAKLAQAPAYVEAVRQCVADPFFVLHVAPPAILAFADKSISHNPAPEHADQLAKVKTFLDASGLSGVTGVTWAGGFDAADWRTDTFIAAAEPRKGLLAVAPPPQIDADLLARVPAEAMSVSVAYMNPAGAVQSIRGVLDATDPEWRANFDKVLGAATVATGAKIEADLLGSLGPQWVAYTSPDVGGPALAGTVLVNKLANPTKAKQAMTNVSISASNYARAALKNEHLTVAGQMIKAGDVNVFYVATPIVAPAWAIKDGYLYLGLFPQTVTAAVQYAGPAFAAGSGLDEALKLTGTSAPLSMSYLDPKPTLGQSYAAALSGSRTLLGLSDLLLAPVAEPVLPPLPAFRKQATPVVEAWWADAGGIHGRSRSPFPGAALMAGMADSNAASRPRRCSSAFCYRRSTAPARRPTESRAPATCDRWA